MRLPMLLWSLSRGRLHSGYGRRDPLIRIDTGGRRKIRIGAYGELPFALSTTRLQIAYFRSNVRQRIHCGFDGGLSPGRKEGGSSPPGTGSSNSSPPDAPVRFVVEVPATIVRALIFSFRYLRFDQRDDLSAILAALDRLGRKPSITRIG